MNLVKIKSQLEEQKQQLMQKITSLNKDIRHNDKPMEKDFSEQATDSENDDVIHALFGEANEDLKKINKALHRLEKGEYELCSYCGEKINIKRLEAVPYTDLCITCAENKE
jgi:DnaK suppressor protein